MWGLAKSEGLWMVSILLPFLPSLSSQEWWKEQPLDHSTGTPGIGPSCTKFRPMPFRRVATSKEPN